MKENRKAAIEAKSSVWHQGRRWVIRPRPALAAQLVDEGNKDSGI